MFQFRIDFDTVRLNSEKNRCVTILVHYRVIYVRSVTFLFTAKPNYYYSLLLTVSRINRLFLYLFSC